MKYVWAIFVAVGVYEGLGVPFSLLIGRWGFVFAIIVLLVASQCFAWGFKTGANYADKHHRQHMNDQLKLAIARHAQTIWEEARKN